MFGGPKLRYVRAEPPLAQCTSSATGVTQLTFCYLRVCMIRVAPGTPVLQYLSF